jgi:polar amino acid transport system ATP-binding protein
VQSLPLATVGGQRQRVAMARELATRPKVMLFDEVTSARTPELCDEVLGVSRRLASEHDLTMLMVPHRMGFAREFADRLCFFSRGKIIEQGPPLQFFAPPQQEQDAPILEGSAGSGLPGAGQIRPESGG